MAGETVYKKSDSRTLRCSRVLLDPSETESSSLNMPTLHQYDYIFAIGTIFAILDAYNIGANDVAK